MKLYSPSLLHLRRHLFSASFSTGIRSPPSSPLLYLQSVLDQIKALSKNPKSHSSLTILDSLLAKTHLLDSATSIILVDYLSRIKKLGRAKTLISHLKSTGKVSDPLLYSLVFDFLVKDGTLNEVENAWAEIRGSAQSFGLSNYTILVCKFGGADEIKRLCERILMGVGEILDRQSYLALIGALCNVNQGFLAKEIVNKMYDQGLEVDHWTHFSMFRCFCRNGDPEEADLVLRKLVESGFTIDVCIYASFLHGLCKSGKFREARKLFRRLTKRGSVGTSGERIGALKKGRRAIFQLSCEGVVPEPMAYESYFRALCDSGQLDDAQALWKKMSKAAVLPEVCVYGSFMRALFRAGRDTDAIRFFELHRKKGFVRADEIGRFVILGLCKKGKSDDALRVLEDTDGFHSDPSVYSSILKSYCQERRFAEAERLFERLKLRGGRRDMVAYATVFHGYCDHGDVSKALALLEEMSRSETAAVDGALYERIVSGLVDCGRVNDAFGCLNEMIENGSFLFCRRWRLLLKAVFDKTELLNSEQLRVPLRDKQSC